MSLTVTGEASHSYLSVVVLEVNTVANETELLIISLIAL